MDDSLGLALWLIGFLCYPVFTIILLPWLKGILGHQKSTLGILRKSKGCPECGSLKRHMKSCSHFGKSKVYQRIKSMKEIKEHG